MTVSSTNTKQSYSGDGNTTVFTYNFKINSQAELTVISRSSLGTETTKTLNSDYTIIDNGASGGSVTFTTAPGSTETIVLIRDTALTQTTDYIASDPFPAEAHESALDKLTLQMQEVQEEVDRSLKLSRTNTMSSTQFTNDATDRALKVFAFDSAGDLSIAQELGSFKGNWATGTAYKQRDIVKDTSTNNVFFVNTSHTSSGSQPLTTNANSAKYSLIVDAASATTSATNAATSETNAASSATAAAASATSAATSATAANTSATNAATSKTNAATSETNAAASATAAASSQSAAATSATGAAASASTATTQASTATTQAATATTQATNASNSASAALTSKTAAASSATAAASSATAAGSSETNASSSATNAASSATTASTAATSAANAQAAAEAALDTFDDKFLGNKASNPSVDNDGNALTDGALYFDTTNNLMKVYDLGTTAWLQLTPSSTDQANINAAVSNATNINAVAGIAANVTAVAGNSTNINAVNSNSSNINTVAGINANVTTVANANSNITAVAGNASNINTVGAAIANVNNVGGSIANVNTVASNLASVNTFGEQYRIGTSDPTSSLDEGDLFYNSTNNTLKVYDGSGWVAGVTAGSGFLPLTGGGLTGALTTNSTIDGRDVSVDGTKLDGIETAATADQTKADIDALNINADTLDGQHGSYYTGYADTAISNLVDSSPAALNTLNELAAALGDDANFSTTVNNNIATKLPLAGGTMTGNLTLDGADIVRAGSQNLTLDVGGRIDLSADDNGEIRLFDGSSLYGQFKDDSDRFKIQGTIADKDMLFVINDGGTETTAIKLDAANGGNATFYGGIIVDGNIDIGDNQKLLLGSHNDLQIYHDGSNSIIADTGTGALEIRADELKIKNSSGDENGIYFAQDGVVNLYHDSNLKANTYASGFAVTGELTASGNITSSNNVTAYSDERLKSDIKTIDNALDKVSQMRGVTFTKDNEKGSGVVAQEMEKVAPELVIDGEYKSVAYGNTVGYLIEAIKELKTEIEELKKDK